MTHWLHVLPTLLRRLFNKRELIVLLTVGVIVIGAIDTLSVQRLEREQEYRQRLMAQQLQAKLQSSLEEHVTALIALNVVYQNFVEINHYDFQQYGQSITANLHGFRRLMFVDPGLVIRRVYPFNAENTRLFGLNLGSDSPFAQLCRYAKIAQKPVTSNLMTFQNQAGSLFAVIPITRSNGEFLGYAVGEIALADIWEPISHADFLSRYRIQLVDPAGHTFFQQSTLTQNDRALTKVTFDVTGRPWMLLLQPKHGSYEGVLIQRVTLWSVGFVILLLLYLLIAASRRYKQYLNEAQKQFETIFHASPDGILMLGDKLRLKLTNPPIQAWSGLSEAELADKSFFDLFTCQCPQYHKCRELSYLLCTSEQFDGELPEILETQITHKEDGMTRTLRLNASRLKENGKTHDPNFICVLGDISTGKELDRVKESYVATLTHDLKTPLIAQELLLDTLMSGKAGAVTPEQQKLLSGASDSVHDLIEMVNASLLFYKLESSHLSLHKHPDSLTEMMKDVIETLRPLADKRKITFELEAAVDLPAVWVDAVQMKRVFHNLLSNAISYANRESAIRITLQADGDERLLVGIRNEGKGIPPEELPRIFEKYYSLSRKFKQIGTGLGLYISRRIVELHGGKIWAISDPEKETWFFVSLPLPQQV